MTTLVTDPIRTLDEVAELEIGPAALALGVFDGVHRGHQALLAATREAAAARAAQPVAVVFDPPPIEIVRADRIVERLSPLDETLKRIAGVGVRPVGMRFDEPLRDLPAEVFLDRLGPGIRPVALVMTPDTAFGKDRAGTPEVLAAIGIDRGFEIVHLDPESDGGMISSSRIRRALADGDVATATHLLGRYPALTGTVVHGDGRGRELGFPTANLAFAYRPMLPALGIYAGLADGIRALVSVGRRPVFHTDGEIVVEAHLFDWDGDRYDTELRVELVARLREERAFASVEALIGQMQTDEVEARAALAAVL